jgi:hypothetical protein
VKAEIRLILDGKKPDRPRGNRGVAQIRIKRVHKPSYVGWVVDQQTPEQLREREMEAELKAQKTAAAILLRRLVNAHPTGERCVQRACPYPAVLDGQCRRHVTDRTQVSSLLQSQLGKGAVFLT